MNNIISIDGGDFVGKTTLISYMEKTWKDQYNIQIESIQNPGHTYLGVKIRELVKNYKMHTEAYKALFLANEIDIFQEIEEHQECYNKHRETSILYTFDRFWVSGIVYQCILPYCSDINLINKEFSNVNTQTFDEQFLLILRNIGKILEQKFSNNIIKVPDMTFILVANNSDVLTSRINRPLDLHEQHGIENINEIYKCVPKLLEHAYIKFIHGTTFMQPIINNLKVIEIDNKTIEQLSDEIMLHLKEKELCL